MGLQVTTAEGSTKPPVFAIIHDDIVGGITLITEQIPTDVTKIYEGAPVVESANTSGLYNISKRAKSTSTQTAATSITVVGPTLFQVGDFIGKYGGSTSSTITVLTRTSAGTDTIVTTDDIGALATATILVELAAAATAAVVAQHLPTAMTRACVNVRTCDLTTIDNVLVGAAYRASVFTDGLPYPLTAGDKTALTARFSFQ